MRLLREVRELLSGVERRFIASAADMDRRGRAGDFGKWPWQKDYEVPLPPARPQRSPTLARPRPVPA